MINRAAVEHRTTNNFCYAIDSEKVLVNIKTGKEITSLKIVHGDPFAWGILGGNEAWTGEMIDVIYSVELENHRLWNVTLTPKYKRLKYYFVLSDGTEELVFFEDGFKDYQKFLSGDNNGSMLQCFTFPWLNINDVFVTPDWVNDTVWYQIFPDRFCNKNMAINPPNVSAWKKGPVTNLEIYGGDLYGVYDKLDYLADLGISGIYFTPIFKATSTHKYDTTDYFMIDPLFGDINIFRKVCERAHELGIKVMIDCVFNHTGPEFAPWLDVKEKGIKSEFYDWFMINSWPIDHVTDTKGLEYYSFAYEKSMPKLNTNNIKVQEYFVDMCKFWVDECDIDAIRIDVANEVSHEFNKYLRKHVKAINPDIFILGEIWHDSMSWLNGDEFDSVMNYPVMTEFNKMWFDQELSCEDFSFNINRIFSMYPNQATRVLFNLLDSHDTDRLITRLGDYNKVLQQVLMLFALPGTPCIYYGTEVLLEGAHDPDCRRCMPWDEIDAGLHDGVISMFKGIIDLRRNHQEMRTLYYDFEFGENKRVIIFNKYLDDSKLQIIINLSDEKFEFITGEQDVQLLTNNVCDNIIDIDGYVVIKKG